MTDSKRGGRKEKASKKKKGSQKDKRRFGYYAAEILVIGTVVMAAIFLPQIIFQVEDEILCSDTTLGKRESINVESLSTAYEKSLAERMRNFAYGLADNKKYYVTFQDLEVNEELTKFLYSDAGLYQAWIQDFVYYNLIPVMIWESYYSVVTWKQYVIYSDHFEEGVNFILWYIEMQDEDGGTLKLLTDAEDNTLYGIKTEGSSLGGGTYSYKEYMEILKYGEGVYEAWEFFLSYYEAMPDNMENINLWAEKMVDAMNETDVSASMEPERMYEEKEVERRNLFTFRNEAEDRISFQIPYGEDTTLDAVLYIEEQDRVKEFLFPDVTAGIRQIYELIPEFA